MVNVKLKNQNHESVKPAETGTKDPALASCSKNRHVVCMNTRTIISSKRKCYIELLNFDMDPNVWFVRRFEKSLLLKTQISSDRFIDEMQARKFAQNMKRTFAG